MTEIENAQPVDLEPVLGLMQRQFQEHAIRVPEERLRIAVAAMLENPELGFFLVARQQSDVIGMACVSFCWTLEHGGKSAWLDELYVLPAYRGFGLGSAMLREALSTAQASGCAAVDLEVDIEHHQAENLVRRAGFEPLPRSRWVKLLDDKKIVSDLA
jgi:ribosomal protein S18 acetylase RimI-like enzyme